MTGFIPRVKSQPARQLSCLRLRRPRNRTDEMHRVAEQTKRPAEAGLCCYDLDHWNDRDVTIPRLSPVVILPPLIALRISGPCL